MIYLKDVLEKINCVNSNLLSHLLLSDLLIKLADSLSLIVVSVTADCITAPSTEPVYFLSAEGPWAGAPKFIVAVGNLTSKSENGSSITP